MSAYVVSDKLMTDTLNFIFVKANKSLSQALPYDFIIKYTDKSNYSDQDILKDLGHLLFKENYKSVNYRYNDNGEYDAYFFNPKFSLWDRIELAQFMRNLSCIEYQSCEHPEYYNSLAYKVLVYLRKWACDFIENHKELKWGY